MHIVMKKCIILSRVSTIKQTLEQQTELLVNKAKNDGYKENEIIIIEDKESAIKKSIDEREGIKKLKNEIASNPTIEVVYIFEISRLGRRMDVLIEMRDYFLNNQIQLFIYNNNQYLLEKKDGRLVLSFAGGLIFTLFSQFAESEMKDKKDRMTRGLLHKRSQNKYIGGNFAFGYKLNENEGFEIDEEKANIVRWIFNEHEKGQSLSSIAKSLYKRGEIKSDNLRSAILFVNNTIHRISYTGVSEEGKYQYPQIISKEQFERCQKIASDKNKPKSNINNVYWCKNLILLKGTNRHLSPAVGTIVYRSLNENRREDISINMNFMDSFTWHLVKRHRIEDPMFDREKERQEASNIMRDAQKKLDNIPNRISKLEKEEERIQRLYISGKINDDRYDELISENHKSIANIRIEEDEYNHTITQMMNRIAYTQFFMYEKKLEEPKSDEEIFDIIHNDIDRIEIEKAEKPHTYILEYFFKDGYKKKFEALRNANIQWVKDKDGNKIDFDMIERFTRKRATK